MRGCATAGDDEIDGMDGAAQGHTGAALYERDGAASGPGVGVQVELNAGSEGHVGILSLISSSFQCSEQKGTQKDEL